ncbi:gluconate kinase [Calothrix sp. HK-06]|nr:gluconate kinase [Calothrix sp. HK-06]
MIILMMGVSGSGKTTIGKALAKSLGWEFSDADLYHSTANIEKMSHGIPLTDIDRFTWLQTLHQMMNQWLDAHKNVVLACSALKESYRQMLFVNCEQVKLIYLKGSFALIADRLEHRSNHFMKKEMLKSQFDVLEEPQNSIQVDISKPLKDIVQEIRLKLKEIP